MPDSRELAVFEMTSMWRLGSAHYGAPYDLTREIGGDAAQDRLARLWIVLSHFEGGDDQTLTAGVFKCGMIQHVWQQPGAPLYLVSGGGAPCASVA